jgi:hypothetical protein
LIFLQLDRASKFDLYRAIQQPFQNATFLRRAIQEDNCPRLIASAFVFFVDPVNRFFPEFFEIVLEFCFAHASSWEHKQLNAFFLTIILFTHPDDVPDRHLLSFDRALPSLDIPLAPDADIGPPAARTAPALPSIRPTRDVCPSTPSQFLPLLDETIRFITDVCDRIAEYQRTSEQMLHAPAAVSDYMRVCSSLRRFIADCGFCALLVEALFATSWKDSESLFRIYCLTLVADDVIVAPTALAAPTSAAAVTVVTTSEHLSDAPRVSEAQFRTQREEWTSVDLYTKQALVPDQFDPLSVRVQWVVRYLA